MCRMVRAWLAAPVILALLTLALPAPADKGLFEGGGPLDFITKPLAQELKLINFFLHSFLFNLFTRIFFYGVIYMRIISLTDFFLHSSPLWSVTPVLGLD